MMRGLLWTLAAALACLSVLILNGGPLFYYDTAGYFDQGSTALRQLGIAPAPSPDPASAAPDAAAPAGGVGGDAGGGVGTVDGSRSAVYAIVAGLLAHLGALDAIVVLNLVAVLLALWLPVRVAVRTGLLDGPVARGVALPLIVASLGSLPFYIAYLMPDIFAPVLLILAAAFAGFGRSMRAWEMALGVALGAFAVVTHLSHLAIAALLVPVVILAAVAQARRHIWVPALLILLVFGAGLAEQKAFRVAAKEVSHSDVVIKPYITARLIQDGPGLWYLEKHCPDPAIATCPLFDALKLSDDPWRLTATHIVFETSPRLGSFRLMTEADQRRVAAGQVGFFLDVLRDMPFATVYALARNTLVQTAMFSVHMTVPTANMQESNAHVTGLWSGPLSVRGLDAEGAWLGPLTIVQGVLYALSLLVIAALVVWPDKVPGAWRSFAVVIVLGILANALVCGGISQPADRYGARVIWLLPMAATLLLLAARRKRGAGQGWL